MIIKPVCPRCFKIAFEYYVGRDFEDDEELVFPKPMSCKHCGHKIKKIEANSGILKRE